MSDEYWDSCIEEEDGVMPSEMLDTIAVKTPENSLLWVFDPDGNVACVTGDNAVYSSAEKTLFVLLSALYQSSETDTVKGVLASLGLEAVLVKS